MPVQTTYEIAHVGAVAGAVVDGQLKNIKSGAAEGIIPFGRLVTRGTAEGQVKLPTTAQEVTDGLGISVRVQDEVANANDLLQFENGADASILDFGVIYVTVEDAVNADGNVFIRFAAGNGGSNLGSARSDTDVTATVATASSGTSTMRFMASGIAGDVVPVRVRLV